MTDSTAPSMSFCPTKTHYAIISSNAMVNFSGVSSTSLFSDITSTYFEGNMHGNSQAKRGYSRDSRPDCSQVCIGLVAAREGFPIVFEIFDGNRPDVTTTREMVEITEMKYGKANRVWVLDRGMVSEDNLEFMRNIRGQIPGGHPKVPPEEV